MLRPTDESANEPARFSETLKIQYLDLGSIPVVSTSSKSPGIASGLLLRMDYSDKKRDGFNKDTWYHERS